MPHQCTKCNLVYPDDSNVIMEGCSCGSKSFLFVRREQVAFAEHIRLAPTGAYEIELGKLLADGSVALLDDGKYEVDLEKELRKA